MPPVVIAAGIGAVGAIGGAVLSSSAQKKAANKASDTAANNTAANNALAREFYTKNSANLLPYSANGLAAGNALSQMLLGTPSPAAAGTTTPTPTPTSTQTPPAAGGVGVAPHSIFTTALIAKGMENRRVGEPSPWLDKYEAQYGPVNGGGSQSLPTPVPGTPTPPATSPPAGTPPAGTTPPTTPALSAWDQFRNSTNYQFRLDQGDKALNQAYAAHGTLESGAAQKGLLEYNQNFAANELGNYQALLAQQQGVGLSAASALAGVGTSMVGQVTANNNSAASAAANAALARGQASANLYGGIASGIGQVAGALESSYGGGSSAGNPSTMEQAAWNYGMGIF